MCSIVTSEQDVHCCSSQLTCFVCMPAGVKCAVDQGCVQVRALRMRQHCRQLQVSAALECYAPHVLETCSTLDMLQQWAYYGVIGEHKVLCLLFLIYFSCRLS
jgi:hypothetical protein